MEELGDNKESSRHFIISSSFTFELLTAKEGWKNIYKGTTIGNKRLLRFETQKIDGLRFKVTKSKAQVVISNIGLFKAPEIDE